MININGKLSTTMQLDGRYSTAIQLNGVYSPTMLLEGKLPNGLTRNADVVENALSVILMHATRNRFAFVASYGASGLISLSIRNRYAHETSNASGTIQGASVRGRFSASQVDGEGDIAAAAQNLNDLTFFLDPMLAGMDFSLPDTQTMLMQFNSTGMDRAPLSMD